MKDPCKLAKLVNHIQHLSAQLERIKGFNLHQHVNHFYSMQKKVELVTLHEQLEETQKRLSWLTTFIEKGVCRRSLSMESYLDRKLPYEILSDLLVMTNRTRKLNTVTEIVVNN